MTAVLTAHGRFFKLDAGYPGFLVPAAMLVDPTTGLPIASVSTEYTEDAAAAADPVGGALILVRKDAPSAVVTTDGDNIATRGTNFGSMYITGLDANGAIWDILTAPSVTLFQEKMLPTTRWSYSAAASGISNTTTAVTIKAADATLSNYITSIQISSGALGAAGEYVIRDGAGGTVLWRILIGTGGLVGGLSIHLGTPLKGTAATLLEFAALTASITGAVYFNAQGFVAA